MTGTSVAIPNPDRKLISEVAMDIGKETVAYMEAMYPDVFAVMNSGCRLSLRNHIHNQIMAALDTINADEIRARLDQRKINRRKYLKAMRGLRT